MTHDDAQSRSEREVLELLPWYVNGTLDDAERERVKRELRSSLTCRREFERLSRMQVAMQGDDAERVAADRGFERLMSRIHASTQPRAASGAQPKKWLPFARAAAVLAFASGLAWWGIEQNARAPGTYETLTTETPSDSRAPQLRLEFAPGLPDAARSAFFSQQGLTVVAPPTPDGIYTIAVPEGTDARAIADRLRKDPRVALVATPAASERP